MENGTAVPQKVKQENYRRIDQCSISKAEGERVLDKQPTVSSTTSHPLASEVHR